MATGTVDPSVIARVSAFSSLDDADKRAIAAVATEETISAGTAIFRESDPSEDVYFVTAGRVSLSMRVDGAGEMIILSVGPGELLGWSGLLGGRRVATGRVIESGTVLRLPGKELSALCERNHRIGYVVMKQLFAALAQRLHDTRLQMLDMFGKRGER